MATDPADPVNSSFALELELPSGEHRERLLAGLANLVRRRGYETLVSAPILLPRSEYFPERWEPTLAGARRLLRRLMHYAGLAELGLRLQGWRERPQPASGLALNHDGGHAVAWFAGIHAGVCEFGLELDELRHQQSLVAALGHEVAHAYRYHHDLVVSDRDLEEKLTDLTSVYLGFGLFALGASLVVETGGYSAAGERLLYEVRRRGYLSPAELALLLAAQLAVRARDDEHRAARETLAANHLALVEQGHREFSRELAATRALLGVPTPAAWPARSELDDSPTLAEEAPTEDEEPSRRHEPEEPAPPEIAFLVVKTRAAALAIAGVGATIVLGASAQLEGWLFYGFCAVAGASGYWAGQRLHADECSSCRFALARRAERCTRCGALIVGEIRAHSERLDAEERYRSEQPDPEAELDDEALDPLATWCTAMLVAWGLSRRLMTDAPSESLAELARRVANRDFDSAALSAAWLHEENLLQDEAMRFSEFYLLRSSQLREADLVILTTANVFDDRPSNYERFAVVLDRRFSDWKATR